MKHDNQLLKHMIEDILEGKNPPEYLQRLVQKAYNYGHVKGYTLGYEVGAERAIGTYDEILEDQKL